MIYILLLIFIGIYWIIPFPVQIILLILNTFVPDMIPVVDELIMTAAVLNRVRKYVIISNFIKTHKILTLLIIIVGIIGIISILGWFIKII